MTLTQTPSAPSEQSDSYPERARGVPYPYASELAQQARELREDGIHINEWYAPGVDLDKAIAQAGSPVLEIGGPTESGYFFLDYRLLPSRAVVGNITDEVYGEYDSEGFMSRRDGVELLIDGRDLPFGDNSLGIVLSAHLPKYDVGNPVIGPLTKKDFDEKVFNLAISSAKASLEEVIRTKVVSNSALAKSLRLAVAEEVYNKLKPGGLYFTDAETYEANAYEALGFDLIASFDETELVHMTGRTENYLSIVLRKPEVA